jgi:hypothetical protein
MFAVAPPALRTSVASALAFTLILLLSPTDQAAASGDADADIAVLLNRAIEAAGGDVKLAKFKAARCKSKGVVYSEDEKASYSAEWTYHGTGELRFTAYYEKNPREKLKLVEVINGDQAWVRVNDGPTEAMPEEQASARRASMYANSLLALVPLKGKEFRLKLLPNSVIANRPMLGIEVRHAGHGPVKLFFDKETNLVAGVERRIKDEGRDLTQEIEFSECKEVQGLKLPFRGVYRQDGKITADDHIQEITILDDIEPGVFAKP